MDKKVLVFQVNTCLEAAADFVMAVLTESCLALCWLRGFFPQEFFGGNSEF